MNLAYQYHNYTVPASKIEVGMELVISKCKSYFIKDGTIAKVTEVAKEQCKDIPEGCIKSGCYRRNIVTGDGVFTNLNSCTCTFHTLDGRRIVADRVYYARKRDIENSSTSI